MVGSPRSIFALLELFVYSTNKPDSLPHWNVVCLDVTKTHVIHQQKNVLKVDILVLLSVFTRQAKKSSHQAVVAPPTTHRSLDMTSMTSCRCLAHECP